MKHVIMIAYTTYSTDNRVRREAEAVLSLPGHSVTILTLREGKVPRQYEKNGVRIAELDMGKYSSKSGSKYLLSYVRFTWLAFRECAKMLARKSLDVVHVHNMPNFLVFAGLIPRLAGKPVILDVHDTMLETYTAKFAGRSSRFMTWGLRTEEAICCRMARRIVCVNDVQKAAMVERNIPEDKIVVAMNVPDPKLFDPGTKIQAAPKEGGKFRMIYHGTVARRLGIDTAIRIVSQLVETVPGLEFHIVGEGDDLEDFREMAKSMGVEGRVIFHGTVPLDNLVPILKSMDLGIIPNRRNVATELMLPVKMLECIALGIPVVAPRLKTISHYFTEEMVFFYEPEDADSMAKAIRSASSSEEDRLLRAREARRFLDRYGWDTHKSDFLAMYRNL